MSSFSKQRVISHLSYKIANYGQPQGKQNKKKQQGQQLPISKESKTLLDVKVYGF